MNKLRSIGLVVILVLSAACAPQPKPSAQAPVAAPSFDSDRYLAAAESGVPVFEINSSASKIWILVDAAGPLAGLGHQHAITSADLEGYIVLSQHESQADLRLPLKSLQVDIPEARRHLALKEDISKDAITATQEHMLESLQAGQFPDLLMQIHELRSSSDSTMAVGNLYLHGVIKAIEVPVDISRDEVELGVKGALKIRQTDFGIKPYSALNGGLRVADELSVSFSLIAQRFTGH